MKGNVPVQNQNLSVLHVCPKIILCRICEKSEPDFSLQLEIGKRPLEQESSHICHHFHSELLITPRFRKQSQSIILQQHFCKVIYTLVLLQSTHLLSFAIFLHLALFMLYSLLGKHSSKYFFTTPFALHVLSYIPFVLKRLL